MGIFGSVQTLDRNVARKLLLAALIEGALEPANQRVDFLLRGLGQAGPRHLAPAQFAHNFLEDLGVLGHGLGAKLVQQEVTGGNELVVATEAVGLNGGPLRSGMLRDLVRGLGEDRGVGRNDYDCTRNAEKPASEFHISPFHADHTEWWSKAGSTTPTWFESLSFAGAAMVCAKKAAAQIAQAASPRRITDRSRSILPPTYTHLFRVLIAYSAHLLNAIYYKVQRSLARGNASCEYFRGWETPPRRW